MRPVGGSDSEVEAYRFILDQLKEMGWDTRNPSRQPSGQVWTQNQCLADPEIQRMLGAARPENVVRLAQTKLWVVEAKRDRSQIKQALAEAEADYARPIDAGGNLTVPLITGVAGNDTTGYEVRTSLRVGDKYVPVEINGHPVTGFLDPASVAKLLESGSPDLTDQPINETVFLRAAERINKSLHIGGINKNDRARVMAALLLALIRNPPDLDSDLPVLIDDINARTKSVLRQHGKEEFHPFVTIVPPTNAENHVKFKAAIVATIQTLLNLSITSAMNSGADVLGKFYEVFLKYGNGAKEIGIVLTPRHITRFAVDTIGVSPTDIVLDPACGTGGFLVAAFDHVRRSANPTQIDRFKKYNLFGIEQESAVAALAIVNMIFRGDGKNNIVEANCFSKFLVRRATDGHATAQYVNKRPPAGEEPVTRVFMNPPFALKESDEKEFRFIEAALGMMADGGMLFAIVPLSVMAEAGREGSWRRDSLLAHHTLLSVVSLPEELFYPVANQTAAAVIRKGTPHPKDQGVLWGRIANDGFRKSKGRRLAKLGPTDLDTLGPLMKAFLADPSHPVPPVPEHLRVAPIDYSDPILELVPEAYLDSSVPDADGLNDRLDAQVRDDVAAIVTADLHYRSIGRASIVDASRGAVAVREARTLPLISGFGTFSLDDLFDLRAGDFHSIAAELDDGAIPVISCADSGNGIIGTFDVATSDTYRDALTISFNGQPLTTKLHPYSFGAKDDVAIAVPKRPMSAAALVFVQAALNAEQWRFSYYRKCFMAKLRRLTVTLPMTVDGHPDIAYMEAAVKAQPYWWFMEPRLTDWVPAEPMSAEPEAALVVIPTDVVDKGRHRNLSVQ